MLTRLIVNLYAWIIEISLWFMLLISGIVGYYFTVPMLHAAGAILENEAVWKIYGALFFVVATFLVTATFIGPFLALVDIRKAMRVLGTRSKRITGSSGSGDASTKSSSSGTGNRSSTSSKGRRLPTELKEPSL